MRTVIVLFALAFQAWSLPIEQEQLARKLFFGGTDPEITMAPDQLIEYWGYKAEVYSVVTQDGYILPLYRIPHGKDEVPSNETVKPVVYLQHGLENSAADWLINLPSESAGFILADAGFDVWIGNFRGTQYSKKHATLKPSDHAFWKFSWDEMASYDLPALINKALEISGAKQVYYVAHSMGTMTGFAQFSSDLNLGKKIKHFYALGPVLNMRHVQGPVKLAAPFTKSMSFMASLFGIDEFLPNTRLQQLAAKYVCTNPLTDIICQNVLIMISGPTHQMNASRIPVIDAHSPAGTSVQNVVHFGQLINSGLFQAYDYGSAKANRDKYGSDQAPIYDVKKMEVPVSIYYGGNDWLASPSDVLYAISQFKNVADTVFLPDFNHMDFAWGIKAGELVFQPIVQSIKKDFSG
jgi:lysosomal acid lipase/cholesteryl ester hydrolase